MIKSMRFRPTHFMVVDEDAGDYVKLEDYNFLLEGLSKLNKVLALCSGSLEDNNKEIARLRSLFGEYLYQAQSKSPYDGGYSDWATVSKEQYDEYNGFALNNVYRTRRLIVVNEGE